LGFTLALSSLVNNTIPMNNTIQLFKTCLRKKENHNNVYTF
jgi:hypothetical protein